LVFAGIFISKIAGVIRTSFIAHYFGLSDAGDAFLIAFRIPNILQNLLGEGVLSASFIPVYASLLAKGESEEADRVAGAVGTLLLLVVAILVAVGITITPYAIWLIAPGFTGYKRELTIQLVRIIFPGTGLLVLGAWCLGVLNSHHKFLLSYAVGAVMNAAQIATLVVFGSHSALPKLAVYLSWGYVAGAALQFGVQLPVVLRLAPKLRIVLDVASEHIRTVTRNFVPVLISRGVVQFSAYIDSYIATFLGTGAVTALASAQQIYMAPIGLFGMSVSAAELPAMSGAAVTSKDGLEAVRQRLNAGLRPISFFVVPSAIGFLALGDVIAAAILQTGRFNRADSIYVWGIMAGASIGLLAQTLGRLYVNGYYALRDPRSPLNFAIIRIVLTTVLGYICAIYVPRWLGVPQTWGAVGLTASAGVAGWVEMFLLRHRLNKRIGHTALPADFLLKLWASALTGAAIAWAVKLALPKMDARLTAILVLGPYSLIFLAMTLLFRIPEAAATFNRILRR
jgi:putative peptidoglycan lipid II flippase